MNDLNDFSLCLEKPWKFLLDPNLKSIAQSIKWLDEETRRDDFGGFLATRPLAASCKQATWRNETKKWIYVCNDNANSDLESYVQTSLIFFFCETDLQQQCKFVYLLRILSCWLRIWFASFSCGRDVYVWFGFCVMKSRVMFNGHLFAYCKCCGWMQTCLSVLEWARVCPQVLILGNVCICAIVVAIALQCNFIIS